MAPGDAAILLVHGFGGGAFSWRHIMQPLADATGQAVVAFDRPGFGERQGLLCGAASGKACLIFCSQLLPCLAATCVPAAQWFSPVVPWLSWIRGAPNPGGPPPAGLTSRPEVAPKTPPMDNPYSVKSQAVLTLKVAWQLGLHRVLLVGEWALPCERAAWFERLGH